MRSNWDKQRLVDSVYFTIYLSCRLGNGNYANYDTNIKISFSSNPPPPLESFAPEDLEGTPPKKSWLHPPLKKFQEESQ